MYFFVQKKEGLTPLFSYNLLLYFFFFCLGEIHRVVNYTRLFCVQIKELSDEGHLFFMAAA